MATPSISSPAAPWDPFKIREVMLTSLPADASQHGGEPAPLKYLYVPKGHGRALDPDNVLVTGIRGAGKSLWWAALQRPEYRTLIAHRLDLGYLDSETVVKAGFGAEANPQQYPDKDTLAQLLRSNADARLIWKTVIFHAVAPDFFELPANTTWPARVDWVTSNPEAVARHLVEVDRKNTSHGRVTFILFDALDRTSDDWNVIRRLVKGLLQILLEFRQYRGLRAKAFLRPDMLEHADVRAFPDASKVLQNAVSLDWSKTDLYGLLWQYFGNAASEAEYFRDQSKTAARADWHQIDSVWEPPALMRGNETIQHELFDHITGRWMGKDARRGLPYDWLLNHLADTRAQVSPRSLLAAVRKSAEVSQNQYSEHPFALHYEAIKRGVQAASQIRVDEVAEDYPWVTTLMEPLRGFSLPCPRETIIEQWAGTKALQGKLSAADKRPPSLDQGPEGWLNNLVELGMAQIIRDGRVNLPDVYRVGYGLGRRGGVVPVR